LTVLINPVEHFYKLVLLLRNRFCEKALIRDKFLLWRMNARVWRHVMVFIQSANIRACWYCDVTLARNGNWHSVASSCCDKTY